MAVWRFWGMLLAGCAASLPTAYYPLETGAVTALTVEGVRYLADEDVVLTAGGHPWKVAVCRGDR